MSRIEEAMRRATVPLGPREAYSSGTVKSLVAEVQTLEHYPEEAAPDARRVARGNWIDAVPSRSAASARGRRQAPLGPFPQFVNGKLILSNATPLAVEQYRRLAGTLHELQAAHGTKTLMVTSAVPREGKTLTVS